MTRTNRNPFIIIEALDGAGKTTQTSRLQTKLKKAGYQVHQFHFPQQDKATGRLIYQKFLNAHNRLKFSRREQALLYLQDFFSKLEDMRQAATRPGRHILISDRYYTSTLAYQTQGLNNASRQKMTQFIKRLAAKGEPALLAPDLVIYLDIPPAMASSHLNQSPRDYFENLTKLRSLRSSYIKTAREEKWTTINCIDDTGKQRSINDIHQEIWQNVNHVLNSHVIARSKTTRQSRD